MQNSGPGGLGEKFEGFGAAPSEALWGSIAGALDEKKAKKGFVWWWIGSGLAAVLLVSAVIYSSTNSNENLVVNNEIETEKLQQEFRAESESQNQIDKLEMLNKQEAIIETSSLYSNTNSTSVLEDDLSKQKINDPHKLKPINTKDAQNAAFKNSDEFAHLIPFSPRSKVSSMNKIPLTSILSINPKLNHPDLIQCGGRSDFFDKPWEIGFRVGYYTDLNPQVQAEYMANSFNSLADQNEPPVFIEGSEIAVAESYNSAGPLGFTGSTSKNINIDFTLAKYISPRFTVQSGVNFTRSTYNTQYQSYEKLSAKTNITSFALPLGIGYDLVKRKRCKFRLTAALNSEFSLYENQNTLYVLGPAERTNGFTKGYSAASDFSIQSQFRMRQGMFLTVSPTYRRYLVQNISADNLLVEKNNWLGGTIGLLWHL